jgi:hypothetical protein
MMVDPLVSLDWKKRISGRLFWKRNSRKKLEFARGSAAWTFFLSFGSLWWRTMAFSLLLLFTSKHYSKFVSERWH